MIQTPTNAMTNQNQPQPKTSTRNGPEIAAQMAADLSRAMASQLASTAEALNKTVSPIIYEVVNRGTETTGRIVTPIAENPLVKYLTKVPVISWVLAALGQVNGDKVHQDVAQLRQQYPLETAEQLTNRVIAEAALQAARVGLLTNIIPPVALVLMPVDFTAIAALQAEMIYRIATIYGFSAQDATRRGEVLLLWGMLTGGSSLVKAGLSLVELLPLLGTAIAIASNSALLFSLGQIARRFYEEKQNSEALSSSSS